MTLFASMLITFIIVYLLYHLLVNKEITTKKIIFIIAALIIAIIMLCFRLLPPESFDLYRYFFEMDYFRTIDFKEASPIIFGQTNFIFYLIEYTVTLVSADNHTIFVFTIPFIIGIFGYILIKMKKEYQLTSKQIAICFFSFFAIINTIHLMSGIRNALAISIYALGTYLLLFKNNKWGYLFYIISLFIHPMVVIIFVIQSIAKVLSKIKISTLILLFWSLLTGLFVFFIKLIYEVTSVNFLKFISDKINVELTTDIFYDYRILIFEIIQIILFIYISYIAITKKEKFDKNLLPFYYLGYFILGSLSLPNIFTRTRFIYAYFLPYMLGINNKVGNKNPRYENILLIVSIIISGFYIYFMYSNGIFI